MGNHCHDCDFCDFCGQDRRSVGSRCCPQACKALDDEKLAWEEQEKLDRALLESMGLSPYSTKSDFVAFLRKYQARFDPQIDQLLAKFKEASDGPPRSEAGMWHAAFGLAQVLGQKPKEAKVNLTVTLTLGKLREVAHSEKFYDLEAYMGGIPFRVLRGNPRYAVTIEVNESQVDTVKKALRDTWTVSKLTHLDELDTL